jgi:hypothetical protein
MAAAALVGCVLTALAACGGTDYSAPPKRADSTQGGCRSPQVSSARAPANSPLQMGQPFSVDLSKLTSTATKLTLTPRDVQVAARVKDRFTDSGTYRPARGYRFLAVSFVFENAGTAEAEAANSVGNQFFLVSRDGGAWPRVDRTEGCSTVSASLASAEKLTSPEEDVRPGGRYTTLVVYAVPTSARHLVWYGANNAVPLEPAGGTDGAG